MITQEKFTHTNQFLLVLVRQVVYTHILLLELQLQEEATWDFDSYVHVRVIGETLQHTDFRRTVLWDILYIRHIRT
jgi:hypothetical protein